MITQQAITQNFASYTLRNVIQNTLENTLDKRVLKCLLYNRSLTFYSSNLQVLKQSGFLITSEGWYTGYTLQLCYITYVNRNLQAQAISKLQYSYLILTRTHFEYFIFNKHLKTEAFSFPKHCIFEVFYRFNAQQKQYPVPSCAHA